VKTNEQPTIDVDANYFYDDFLRSGWSHSLIADEKKRSIRVFSRIGAGQPACVANGSALLIDLPPCRGKELIEWLDSHVGTVANLFAMFDGGDADELGYALELFEQELGRADLPTRWPASEWFGADHADSMRRLFAAIEDGQTVSEWAQETVEDDVESGAILTLTDVLSWASDQLQEWARDITWHVPPANQGQIVTVSYGCDDDGTLWEKTFDSSDRSTSVRHLGTADSYEGRWEPWNAAP